MSAVTLIPTKPLADCVAVEKGGTLLIQVQMGEDRVWSEAYPVGSALTFDGVMGELSGLEDVTMVCAMDADGNAHPITEDCLTVWYGERRDGGFNEVLTASPFTDALSDGWDYPASAPVGRSDYSQHSTHDPVTAGLRGAA